MDSEEIDLDMVYIDKEFLYYLLSCLIAQKNINRLDYDGRALVQESIDKAFDDGVSILKNEDFIPKCDVLFKRTIIKLGAPLMDEYYGRKIKE